MFLKPLNTQKIFENILKMLPDNAAKLIICTVWCILFYSGCLCLLIAVSMLFLLICFPGSLYVFYVFSVYSLCDPGSVLFVFCRERLPSWTGPSCQTHRTSVPAKDTSVVSAAGEGCWFWFKLEKLRQVTQTDSHSFLSAILNFIWTWFI